MTEPLHPFLTVQCSGLGPWGGTEITVSLRRHWAEALGPARLCPGGRVWADQTVKRTQRIPVPCADPA